MQLDKRFTPYRVFYSRFFLKQLRFSLINEGRQALPRGSLNYNGVQKINKNMEISTRLFLTLST